LACFNVVKETLIISFDIVFDPLRLRYWFWSLLPQSFEKFVQSWFMCVGRDDTKWGFVNDVTPSVGQSESSGHCTLVSYLSQRRLAL
jgi:hypothetical protein